MEKSHFVVLMAEDNKHDIIAAKRAWTTCQRGKYSEPGSAPRPVFLLLDIKIPKMDGLDVLKRIR